MKRSLVIGLFGLALVLAGAIWAWVNFAQIEPIPAPQASAPPRPSSPPGPRQAQPAPPIASPTPPTFDVVRINPLGDAVVAGRAAPNSQVIIYDGDREIGRAQADGRGEWVFVPNQALPSGARELSLSAQNPGDAAAVRSDQVVVLAVPERGRDLAGQPVTEPAPSIAVATPREGGRSTVLLGPSPRAPGATPGGVAALALDVIDYDEAGEIILGGVAPPGATIQVYLDNQPIGRTVADAAGNWTITPDVPVPPGRYTIRVDQLGADGRVAARVEVPFARAEPAQLAASEGQIIVQPGNSLWRIARRTYGQGTRFVVLYEANKNQIRDPDLIYPGQVFVVPKTN